MEEARKAEEKNGNPIQMKMENPPYKWKWKWKSPRTNGNGKPPVQMEMEMENPPYKWKWKWKTPPTNENENENPITNETTSHTNEVGVGCKLDTNYLVER